MSQFGLGTSQSFEDAKKAYEASNTPNSLYYLGWLYKRGLGVTQDPFQALSLWEQAADLGHTLAAYRAGKAHFKMWKIDNNEEDAQKAYLYLSQASEFLPDAMSLLAYLQKKGIGCKRNTILSTESYRKAAEKKHAHAQFKTGQFIEEIAEKEDWEEESFRWYEQAALQECKKAKLAMVRFYREGIVDEPNLDLAYGILRTFESTIDSSQFKGIKQLAKEERHGESLRFIEQQADKGNIPALIFMAKVTEEGTLVSQDTSKAISLYQRAWEKGNRSAYLRLRDLERAHVLKILGLDINL